MFEKSYEDRLAAWHDFRQTLEDHNDPLQAVIDYYCAAPKVYIHTDPWTKTMWPDPWQLVHENEYDDFCCVLGMCYSLQLTDRFKGSSFEIHISTDSTTSSTHYLLFVDDTVLGWDEESYVDKRNLPKTLTPQEIYVMPVLQ